MLKQNTLKESFALSGKGLHTGLRLTVTFLPAPVGHGYKIQRTDMPGQPIMDAVAENVIDTQRGTVLGQGDMRCSTVEHAMAALYALGIDNVLIQVDGPEFPILDGSAEPFVREIQRVGLVEQEAPKDYYYITKKMEFRDDKTGACITLLPDEDFSITSMIAFDGKVLSSQFATLDSMDKFATEVAAARTFVFVREIEQLLLAGLIKGGDLDNAIVIYERQTTQENLDKLCQLTGSEHHDATELGYVQHKPLVWDNEPARHKLLDIIGDMALIGKPIKGRIIATRPGHTINNMFARMMRKEIRKHEVQAPKYDPNKTPLMDVGMIKKLLPHRYPMQLVDKVIPERARHARRSAHRGNGTDRRPARPARQGAPRDLQHLLPAHRQRQVPAESSAGRYAGLPRSHGVAPPPQHRHHAGLCLHRRELRGRGNLHSTGHSY